MSENDKGLFRHTYTFTNLPRDVASEIAKFCFDKSDSVEGDLKKEFRRAALMASGINTDVATTKER